MMSLIYRIVRVARYAPFSLNPAVLRVLSRWPKLHLSILETRPGSSRVFLRGTDVDATTPVNQFLLRGSDCVQRLMEEARATFRPSPDGVLLEVGGVTLLLQYWEELFIAHEVFVEGDYNLRLHQPFVLIDVGMNVGTTSLFFARQEACRAVHGYELFPPTAEKAARNLALNPAFAGKIHWTAKGLAARPRKTEMDYIPEFKGSVGINSVPDYIRTGNERLPVRKVNVELVSCAEVFSEVFRAHSQELIACKLDCEGAEYEILEALGASGQLPRVSRFLIEFHGKGAAPIEALLERHGFEVLSFAPHTPAHSMIYAWRPTPPPA